MRYTQLEKRLRSSKPPNPRVTAMRAFWAASAASVGFPVIRRHTA